MVNDYQILKLDKLAGSKRWVLLIAVGLIIIGILCMNNSIMKEPPIVYSNEDNTYQLRIEQDDNYNNIIYFLNNKESPKSLSMKSDGKTVTDVNINNTELTKSPEQISKYVYNWNFRGDGLDIIGLFIAIVGIYLMFKSGNSLNYCMNKIIMKFQKEDVTTIPQISSAPNGIIGIRVWRTIKGGFLKSSVQDTRWENAKVKSSAEPQKGTTSGIYAYRLNSNNESADALMITWGIVVMTGKCVGHGDNIIRASHCTILALITKKKELVELLKKNYSVPVYYSTSPIKSINKWAMSSEGLFWMSNNAKLIEEKIGSKIQQDVNEIITRKQF